MTYNSLISLGVESYNFPITYDTLIWYTDEFRPNDLDVR